MSDPNPETGYREDCCWTFERQYCPGRGGCKCRCHVDAKPRHTGHDPQTLLWVADDLRRTAEAHFKQADITAKRIERKYLRATGSVLIGRAIYYETVSQGKAEL